MTGNRKLPLRKCIGCGMQKEKKQLIRIVRTPEGDMNIDPAGRANGRGAYICSQSDCLEKALKTHALERSLHSHIDPQIYADLQSELSVYLDGQSSDHGASH